MLNANYWHWSSKYCTGSNIYGFGLCADSELWRQYYHEEYPLYYFLGFTHMAIKAVPGTPSSHVSQRCDNEINENTLKAPKHTRAFP